MQIVSKRDSLPEMSNPIFYENINLLSAELGQPNFRSMFQSIFVFIRGIVKEEYWVIILG